MTKEELEKEATEYAKPLDIKYGGSFVRTTEEVKQAYLAGAEPREKKIAELEKENAELKKHLKCLIAGMYHIAQHHPTMGAHTKIMQDLREAEQFLNSEVEK